MKMETDCIVDGCDEQAVEGGTKCLGCIEADKRLQELWAEKSTLIED